MTIALILAVIIGVWGLAFVGAPVMVWAGAFAAYAAALFFTGVGGPVTLGITLAVTAIFSFFSITPLRRLLTAKIFTGFKKVLPEMSSTEREALEAGDVWWEGEMFRGKPDWNKLVSFERTRLTDEEQSFLDNECNELCSMLDEWEITGEHRDLPKDVWDYIRTKGFFGMLISKEHGGLGFSAYAQSCVVTKIASRSITAAVTVMVPNSLGPGELLMHYGTPEQQKRWLPGLSNGDEIPCFGLTSPEAGSDATTLTDTGIVCKGQWEGKEILGMKLNFSKRYITLAPVATVVGLAFKLYDPDGLLGNPDKTDYGITCALLPADTEGVQIGRRHFPGSTFMNGPIHGKDIFVPLDWIIGGPEKAGKGWRMLVECLSAGRGISLPALSAAACETAYRLTGAYSRVRRQFKMPIGKFEGVQEVSGRIAGLNYRLEAMRILTASAVDTCAPSVVTAIAKMHMTDTMRTVLTYSMDIHGGRGVMLGPRNYLATAYQAVPVAITVEGANILTRSLMIFGQGAIRCHPYVFPEMEAAREDNLEEFDRLLWGHVGFSVNRGARALTLGMSRGLLSKAPVSGASAGYYKELERMSSALAFVSDVTMGVLGGDLKRKESLSARLGDVLSHLYMASAVLKYYYDEGQLADDTPHMQWCVEDSLYEIDKAFSEFFDNFPVKPVAALMRFMVFPPLSKRYKPASDNLTHKIAGMMLEPSAFRDRLTWLVYTNKDPHDVVGRMEVAFDACVRCEPAYNKFQRAVAKGQVFGLDLEAQLSDALEKSILSVEEADQVREYDPLRLQAVLTDDFSREELEAGGVSGMPHHDADDVMAA